MNRLKIAAVSAVTIAMLGGSALFAQAVPQQQQQMQQQAQIEVSDADLKKFADAYQEIQIENQKVQMEMSNAIQTEGLDVQRFNEIHASEMSPDQDVEVAEDEKVKYEKALEKMEEKQVEFQEKVETVITGKGLTMNRYQQVGMALQNDEALQERLRAKMAEGQ